MASETAKSLTSVASSIDGWVAQQQARNAKRKTLVATASFDPKEARNELQKQLLEVGEFERAMDRLQDALNNAQPALEKLRSQAKKDEATLLAAVATGGGEPLSTRTPFVAALLAAGDPIATKAKQAANDIDNLAEQIRRDGVLANALDNPKTIQQIVKLLEEASSELAHVASAAQQACDSIARDL